MVPAIPTALAAVLAAANAVALAQPGLPFYYVDDDAPSGGDGGSWETAFRDLQDALEAARKSKLGWGQIRVAQGTYTPDRGTLDRAESFALTSAVTLMGGFAGLGAPYPDHQDPARFVSILSGDLRRDDAPNFGNRDDNSYHVVDISAGGGYISGFTIRGGHADSDSASRGGGIFSASGSWAETWVSECRITDNYARVEGAGASLLHGRLAINNSLVAANRVAGGGSAAGIACGGFLAAQQVRFAANVSDAASYASALAAVGLASDIRDCLFDANDPALPVLYASSPYPHPGAELLLLRSTFADNAAGAPASVVIAGWVSAKAEGCIFHNPPTAPEILLSGPGASLRIDTSLVRGGGDAIATFDATLDWRPGNIDADPEFADRDGPDDDPLTWRDNAYSPAPTSPCIDAGARDILSGDADLVGNARFISARGDCHRYADMGAIEYQHALPPPPPVRLFVRPDAPPGGDGLSWSTAFRDLDEALSTPGVREVWLAAGTYSPDAGTGDEFASYDIQCPIRILGGFDGSEDDPDQRDPVANPTVLSGDLLANDDETFESRADNSRSIIKLQRADAVIDGVTIAQGHGAAYRGGEGTALDIKRSRLTLRNSIVRDCTSVNTWLSAAAYIDLSDVVIERSVIRDNRAVGDHVTEGAALYMRGGDLSIIDSTFASNSIQGHFSAEAPALYARAEYVSIIGSTFTGNRASCTAQDQRVESGAATIFAHALTIANSSFIDNEAVAGTGQYASARYGAGRFLGHSLSIINSVFHDNRVQGHYAGVGAFSFHGYEHAEILNCTIVGNESIGVVEHAPGGVARDDPSYGAVIANTILWGNRNASGESVEAQLDPAGLTLAHNCIQGWDGSLPGEGNFSADPLFLDDLRLAPGSPCISAGDAALLPADALDLDRDGDIGEPLPLDAAKHPRLAGPGLDIGAFETQTIPCPADHNADGTLDSSDLFAFLSDFFSGAAPADVNDDGVIDSRDAFEYITVFLAGC